LLEGCWVAVEARPGSRTTGLEAILAAAVGSPRTIGGRSSFRSVAGAQRWIDAIEDGPRCRIDAAIGEGRGRLRSPLEQVDEQPDGVGDVELTVVVDIAGVSAGRELGRATWAGEEIGEREDGITEVDSAIAVTVTASEISVAMVDRHLAAHLLGNLRDDAVDYDLIGDRWSADGVAETELGDGIGISHDIVGHQVGLETADTEDAGACGIDHHSRRPAARFQLDDDEIERSRPGSVGKEKVCTGGDVGNGEQLGVVADADGPAVDERIEAVVEGQGYGERVTEHDTGTADGDGQVRVLSGKKVRCQDDGHRKKQAATVTPTHAASCHLKSPPGPRSRRAQQRCSTPPTLLYLRTAVKPPGDVLPLLDFTDFEKHGIVRDQGQPVWRQSWPAVLMIANVSSVTPSANIEVHLYDTTGRLSSQFHDCAAAKYTD